MTIVAVTGWTLFLISVVAFVVYIRFQRELVEGLEFNLEMATQEDIKMHEELEELHKENTKLRVLFVELRTRNMEFAAEVRDANERLLGAEELSEGYQQEMLTLDETVAGLTAALDRIQSEHSDCLPVLRLI